PTPTESGQPTATGTTAATTTTTATATTKALSADTVYRQRCQVCHGVEGKGDGPGAAALNPKPRTLADAEWQKSVTDEQIEKVILQGGASIGKSSAMPGNPDLRNKPEVVSGLVKKVRAFGK